MKDISLWTFSYVNENEDACVNEIIKCQNKGLATLKKHKYEKSAQLFEKVVTGMAFLVRIDSNYYEPPMYAAQYILGRIYAFGLKNTEYAIKYIDAACASALNCAFPGRSTYATAKSDYKRMYELCYQLKSGTNIYKICDVYGSKFPYDILSTN